MSSELIYDVSKGLRHYTTTTGNRLALGTYYRSSHDDRWQVLTLSQREATQRYVWMDVLPDQLPKRLRAEALLLGVQV